MTQAFETHPSVAVYTPARLALCDVVILGLSCSVVWGCPKRHFLDLYNQHVRRTPMNAWADSLLTLRWRDRSFVLRVPEQVGELARRLEQKGVGQDRRVD
jgi:hypothetical protein